MVIIGIDIETTGGSHNICEFAAVGLETETGAEIFSVTSLVDPGPVKWNYFAMRVHGISPEMVCGKPNIAEVWNSFKKVLSGYTPTPRCFAHNASFERTHLGNGLVKKLDVALECTIALAKTRIALNSYKLPLVCAALGIPFNETHRAEADARAAALVAHRLLNAASVHGPRRAQSVPLDSALPQSQKRSPFIDLNAARGVNSEIIASTKQVGCCFVGKRVCITGTFPNGMTKEQGKRRIASHGGIPVDNVTNATSIVVLAASGETIMTRDLSTAKAQQAFTYRLELMAGPTFLRLTD